MFTRRFVLATTERALKTAAQSAILVLGADGFNALHADWELTLGFALGGAALSILTSVASAKLTWEDSPSLVKPSRTL